MKRLTKSNSNAGDGHKLGDCVIYDDLTGFPIWYSEGVIQGQFTGKAGFFTQRDYAFGDTDSLVPWTPPREQPAPMARGVPPEPINEATPVDEDTNIWG